MHKHLYNVRANKDTSNLIYNLKSNLCNIKQKRITIKYFYEPYKDKFLHYNFSNEIYRRYDKQT